MKQILTFTFIPLILLATLTGCSNRGVYESIQMTKRNDCSKVPPYQFDDCMAKANKPYDEYERERKAATDSD